MMGIAIQLLKFKANKYVVNFTALQGRKIHLWHY